MKPLHEFDAEEADRWLSDMRRSLASHVALLPTSRDPRSVRAAIETHLMLMRELARVHPGKRDEIESVIADCAMTDP